MPNSLHIIEVVIPLYLERTFHYQVPASLLDVAIPGRRALVPFGPRTLTAYIIATVAESPHKKLKDIKSVLDTENLWTEKEMEFFRWIAAYYLHPLGEVIKTALPAGINLQSKKVAGSQVVIGGKKVKLEQYYCPVVGGVEPTRPLGSKSGHILELLREIGELSSADLRRRFGTCTPQLRRLMELKLICLKEREVYRDPFADDTVLRDTQRKLNSYQSAALQTVVKAIDNALYAPYLLHGVTGSGKTEVYLQAIAHALLCHKKALVLVPEISLTPQLVQRFRARFGAGIAVLHSALSDGERYDEWRRIRRGQVQIVIGARSALFAPLDNLGIIVVDEEHEGSFKQSEGLRYNARDLALVRGKNENAVVLLGSATPQITTLYAVKQGRIGVLSLPVRVAQRPMPTVEVVQIKGKAEIISLPLKQALQQVLVAGEQSLVFLNRRGFATTLVCAECNAILSCPNCSVTLTYHRQRQQSVCHYCDYAVPAPSICPACDSPQMQEMGAGTEKVEQELRELLPTARVIRMDSDTTSGKGGHNRLLNMMNDRSADILIGTQMIAKGHDFPGVTFVGVLDGEASLNMPDFRSSERTFQILSQVFGRAGRGEIPGKVIIQTRNPEHYALQCAINHDGAEFFRQELEFRREAGYPPFSHLATISFSGVSENGVETRSLEMAALFRTLKQELKLRVEILGATPSPLYRLRGRYRRHILLKAPSRNELRRLIAEWQVCRHAISTVRENVDIDPVDMM